MPLEAVSRRSTDNLDRHSLDEVAQQTLSGEPAAALTMVFAWATGNADFGTSTAWNTSPAWHALTTRRAVQMVGVCCT